MEATPVLIFQLENLFANPIHSIFRFQKMMWKVIFFENILCSHLQCHLLITIIAPI